MCPDCIRGLVRGEVCQKCAGKGFWNPLSEKDDTATETTPVVEMSTPVETSPPEVAPIEATPVEVSPEGPSTVEDVVL